MTRTEFKNGISLIEVVVYVALLGVFAIFIVNSLLHTTNAYYRARAEREVVSNARLILETINNSIAQAQEVYTPTSRFNSDAGQLSLITQIDAPVEHSLGYVDYWVDNGIVLVKKEGQATTILSSPSVKINKLRLERIIQGLGREAVKISLQVDYVRPKFATSLTLNSAIALRGNY